MSEFIEVISPQAKQQIADIMVQVDLLASKIKSIPNFQLSNTPSGADNAIKQLTNDLAKQAKEIDNLKNKLAGLNQEKQKSATLTTQQKVDDAIILKQEKQQATLTSAYADAYAKLNTQRTIAKTKLQDLIASERASNAEIRKAQKEFDVLNKKVAAADKAVGRFSEANRQINGLTKSVGNLMTAFGIGTGLYLAVDIVKGIYDTTKALQSMDLALKMVSETPLELAKNQQFVTETAEKWGLEIKTLQQTFTQFYTASKGLLTDDSIKTTFEGIAKAGSIMGLSLEQQQAAFYAIDQMMSKGTVTAEELKKQLGNAMPGAIKAAAMAYMELHPAIKSIQEAEKALYADMKKGAIDSATYVPLIAKNFQILYGIESLNSVHTMQAAQNRLQNSWTEWVRGLSSGGAGLKIIVSVMESLAKNLSAIISTLAIGTVGWLAYKTAVMLANAQTKLLALTTTTATVATAEQTVVTGFQTAAQVANATATNVATTAWQRFTLALKANALGLAILALGAAIVIFNHFNKSIEETTAEIKDANNAFITNREIVTETIIENKRLIDRYEELRKKTKLTKEEQLEYNGILADLSKKVPNAITGVNNYGVAISLNTEILKKYNAELEKQLGYERKIALAKDRELLPQQQINVAEKQAELNETLRFQKAGALKQGGKDIQLAIAEQQLALSIAKNELTMTAARIKSMASATLAEKQSVIDDLEIKKDAVKNVEWYDKKISELEKTKEGFTKRGEGLEYQKQLKQLQKERAFILGEEEKVNKTALKKDEKAREQHLKDLYDLKMAQLDQDKIILEQGLENEKLNYSERLNFAYLIAAKELEIADTKYKEEQRLSEGNNDKLKIADINYWKDKEKIAKEAIKRIQDVQFKPQYERQQLADPEKYGEGVGVLGESQTQDMVNLWQKGQDKIKETEEDRIKRLKALRDVLNDVFQEFGQATGFESTMDMFAIIGKNGEDFWTNLTDKKKISEIEWNEWGLAITTVAQDAMNVIDQADEERYQRRLERLEKDKETALKYAGDSAAAKEKIEAQYEKKRKALEVKEFKRKQKMAMANIAIDTAQAIMAVIAKSGQPWMSVVVGALGAVQLAMVASQKPPEYWKGTDNAEAGLAWTQERGAEIVMDKHNRIKSFGNDGGAQLTMLDKGDKVKTADQTKRIMFDAGLNSILSDNGIKQAKIEIVNKGLTVDEMDMVIGKYFANIQTNHTSFDQRGIQQWSEKNGNRTIRNANRGSGIGFRV